MVGKSEKGREIEYLVREFGWGVRKLYRVGEEVRMAAYVQAEAFYEPMAFLNGVFYEFYKVSGFKFMKFILFIRFEKYHSRCANFQIKMGIFGINGILLLNLNHS